MMKLVGYWFNPKIGRSFRNLSIMPCQISSSPNILGLQQIVVLAQMTANFPAIRLDLHHSKKTADNEQPEVISSPGFNITVAAKNYGHSLFSNNRMLCSQNLHQLVYVTHE